MRTAAIILVALLASGCVGMGDRTRREQYVVAHPEISSPRKRAILGGEIYVGMPAIDLLASWGDPIRINRTVTASGARAQWVYGVPRRGLATYVYVENGVVTAWQD